MEITQELTVRMHRDVRYRDIDTVLRMLTEQDANGVRQPKSLMSVFVTAVECLLSSGAFWVWHVADGTDSNDGRPPVRALAMRVPIEPSSPLLQSSVATFSDTIDVFEARTIIRKPPRVVTDAHPNTALGGVDSTYIDVTLEADIENWDHRRHTVALMTQKIVQNENNAIVFGLQWLYFGSAQVIEHTAVAASVVDGSLIMARTIVRVRLDVNILASLCCLSQYLTSRSSHTSRTVPIIPDSIAQNNVGRLACAVDIWRHMMCDVSDTTHMNDGIKDFYYSLVSWDDAVRQKIRTCADERSNVWVDYCFRSFYEQRMYVGAFSELLSPALLRVYRRRLSPASASGNNISAVYAAVQAGISKHVEWYMHMLVDSSNAHVLDIVVANAVRQSWPLCTMYQSDKMVLDSAATVLNDWVADRERAFLVHLLHYWIPISYCEDAAGAERTHKYLLNWLVNNAGRPSIGYIVSELCSSSVVQGSTLIPDSSEWHSLRDMHPPVAFPVDAHDATVTESLVVDNIRAMTKVFFADDDGRASSSSVLSIRENSSQGLTIHHSILLFLRAVYNAPQQIFETHAHLRVAETLSMSDTAWLILQRMLGVITGYQSLDSAFCSIVADTDFMRMFTLWVNANGMRNTSGSITDMRFLRYIGLLVSGVHLFNYQPLDRTVSVIHSNFATHGTLLVEQWDIVCCWFFVAYISPSLDIVGNEESIRNMRASFLRFMLYTIMEPFGSNDYADTENKPLLNWWDFVIASWNSASPYPIPRSASSYWSIQTDLNEQLRYMVGLMPPNAPPNSLVVGLYAAIRDFLYTYPIQTQQIYVERNRERVRNPALWT